MKVYLTIPYIYEVRPITDGSSSYNDIEYVSLGETENADPVLVYLEKAKKGIEGYEVSFDFLSTRNQRKLKRLLEYTGQQYTLYKLFEKLSICNGSELFYHTRVLTYLSTS